MDTDFDFLNYLDFGGNAGGGNMAGAGQRVLAGSGSSFDFDFTADGPGSASGSSSISSTYASPQDRSAGTSEWSASSPSASSASVYSKSPLFGSVPSLFDATSSANFSWDSNSLMNSFGMKNSINSSNSNNIYASSNSPPFDISIYANGNGNSFGNGGELSNHVNVGSGSSNINGFDAANPSNYGAHAQSNPANNFQAAPPTSEAPPANLAQQWQQLMLQQAQLQLQIQMQNAGLQQPQFAPQQQQQFNQNNIASINLQGPPPIPDMQFLPEQQQQQQQQPQIQLQLQPQTQQQYQQGQQTSMYSNPSSSWSSPSSLVEVGHDLTAASTSLTGPTSNSTNVPSVFALPSDQIVSNIAQRGPLPSTCSPSESHDRPIAKMPSQQKGAPHEVSVTPSSTAHHVASLRPGKITKTGLKRSYQQVKQEENSDEEAKRAAKAPGLSRSASAESSNSTGTGNADASGEDGKSSKKTPGGHNAVEQKYRRGINDSLIMLREIVPALQHLRAPPGLESSKRKQSQFSLGAAIAPVPPSGFVDGVMAPTKLSKQLILVTATDYIRFLQNKRREVEGELEAYKQAITDCVEDGSVVIRLVEERWAPKRAEILRQREEIYESRVASKEQSKKQARLERQKNASVRKAYRSASAGNDGQQASKEESEAEDSDDEEDEDDDDNEEDGDMDEDPVTAKSQGVSTGVAGRKSDVKARAGKGAAAKKAGGGTRKKPAPAAAKATATASANIHGSSKALMSVFAGVSFVGGASYDVLFGSSAAAGQGSTKSVSPEQVWSRGNILRRDYVSPQLQAASEGLPAIQAFFLRRPALLSGLVMLALSTITAYIIFSALPSIWARLTGSSATRKREAARQTLARKVRRSGSVSQAEERAALALLANIPAGAFSQVFALPAASMHFVLNALFGNLPSHFPTSDDGVDAELLVDCAVSAVRWLEMSQGSSALARLTGSLHLYNALRSPSWPATQATVQLFARAEAVLALTIGNLLGDRFSRFAKSSWTHAQQVLKKEDAQSGWLSAALALSYEEARTVLPGHETISPLFAIAQVSSQAKLVQGWRNVFSFAVRATTSDIALASGTHRLADDDQQLFFEITQSMPTTSTEFALALLPAGIKAMQTNEKQGALSIALQMTPTHLQQLASVRAFCCLVNGRLDIPALENSTSQADAIAYCTIAWLAVHQISKLVQTQKGKSEAPSGSAGPIELQPGDLGSGLQMATLRLRKVLSSPAFTDSVDDDFVDAQDRCVEGLVNIGRKAAGLDALSDSGCEL